MTPSLPKVQPTNAPITQPRPPRKGPLPVTVLSGFVGSGKTTLLNHVLEKADGLRIAAIINGTLPDNSIDVSGDGDREIVRLENGCICCTLCDSLTDELLKLAQNPCIDYCVVVSSGASEPMPVADLFTSTVDDLQDESGKAVDNIPFSKFVSLDTMVTVLDAKYFPSDLASRASSRKRGGEADVDGADWKVPELLAEQLEFANVVVVNKCDLVSETEAKRVSAAVRAFNVNAVVIQASHSKVALNDVIGTQAFSFEEASSGKRWLTELRQNSDGQSVKKAVSDLGEISVSSVVYRRRRPFDPRRFAAAAVKFARMGDTILRSKGFVWLATKNEGYAEWSQVGVAWTLNPGGRWLCATPREEWPTNDEKFIEMVQKDMNPDPAVGDRRQELVFLGQGLDKSAIEKILDDCLLSDEEMKGGAAAWLKIVDPFGVWDFALESDVDNDDEDDDADKDGEPNAAENCACSDVNAGQPMVIKQCNGEKNDCNRNAQSRPKRVLSEEDISEDTTTKKRAKTCP